MKYYLVRYTDELAKGFGGLSQGPIIKLLSKYRDDVGLLEHEKMHVRQWYSVLAIGLLICTLLMLLVSPSLWPMYGAALFLHQMFYKCVRPYRRWCEVKAYRKQIEVGGYISNDFAVAAIVEKYDLGLSVDEARALLLN